MAQDTGDLAELVAGAWSFRTEQFNGDCQMTGEMQFTQTDVSGILSCNFTVSQSCERWDASIVAEQSCVAKVVNNALMIESEVIEVTVPDPRFDPNLYYRDNFSLRVIDANTMRGVAQSVTGPTPAVEFTRVEVSIS